MLSILKNMADVYEYIVGGKGDPLCDKIAQFRNFDRVNEMEMEGSVGVCNITEDGKYIEKRIKNMENINSSVNKLLFAATTTSIFNQSSANMMKNLANKLELEGDLENEYYMQSKFYEKWKDCPNIKVPKPISIIDGVLTMEYYDKEVWKSLINIESSEEKWLGFTLLIKFFFKNFKNYNLIHGDISPYNVLINVEDKNNVKICVLDYGLSCEFDGKKREGFDEMANNPPHKFSQDLLDKWWDKGEEKEYKREDFTEEWLNELKNDFTLNTINSKNQLPPDSPTLKVLGLFVRSVLNLSNMAVNYSKF